MKKMILFFLVSLGVGSCLIASEEKPKKLLRGCKITDDNGNEIYFRSFIKGINEDEKFKAKSHLIRHQDLLGFELFNFKIISKPKKLSTLLERCPFIDKWIIDKRSIDNVQKKD